jgi:DNA-binding LacI/PurR family transcriptional regulator
MLSALSAYRRFNKPVHFHGTIAWVVDNEPPRSWFALYYAGAAERAAKYGYHLERFWLNEPGMSQEKASKVLVSRGVRGLLLSPSENTHARFNMDWDSFSVVKFGYSIIEPQAHLVTSAHYSAVATIIKKFAAKGFNRIGYVSAPIFEERVDNNFMAAFLTARYHLPESQAIPILFHENLSKPVFMDWFKKYRPQAIVTWNDGVPGWLREAGCRLPDDVSVAIPNLPATATSEDNRGLCGVVDASLAIGSTAVDLLSTMLLHGERGIPANPLKMLIEGTWVDFSSEPQLPHKEKSLCPVAIS